MNIILVLFVIFWEQLVLTNADKQEKTPEVMDLFDECLGETCAAPHRYVEREITIENLTGHHPILIPPPGKSTQNEIEKDILLPVKLNTLNQSNSETERKSFLNINQLRTKREKVQLEGRSDHELEQIRKILVDGTAELVGLKTPILVEYFGQAGVDILGLSEACSNKVKKLVSEYEMNIKDKLDENEIYEAQSLGTSYGDEIYKVYYYCRTKMQFAYYEWEVSVNVEVKRRGISIMESSIATNKKYIGFDSNYQLQNTIKLQKSQLSSYAREKLNEYKDAAKNGLDGIAKIVNDSASSIYDLVKSQADKLRALADRKTDNEEEIQSRIDKIEKNLRVSNNKKYDAVLDEMTFLNEKIYAIADEDDSIF